MSPTPERPAGPPPADARPAPSSPADVVAAAAAAPDLAALADVVTTCRACPRLVAWRRATAADPPARYRGQTYWARPVPGFGDEHAGIALVGLAPAADGGNRTGRMFTGDRSGDFLVAALHRAGLASQPTSEDRDDGLVLTGVRMTAPVRCAPPANAPTPAERRTCGPWLARELALVDPRVVVVLGGFGWRALLTTLDEQGWGVPRPRPAFGHGVELTLRRGDASLVLLGCFHVSPHNTFTGRLTPQMLDAVLERAKALGGGQPSSSAATT
ncbi:uracil-DNA glycosylase [Cellulomonas flavigena]|uniref:uracil-DNA glycosylase n=1 Tax=Cellulomonas flavigena TaxID=1711 RepID=UPI00315D2782